MDIKGQQYSFMWSTNKSQALDSLCNVGRSRRRSRRRSRSRRFSIRTLDAMNWCGKISGYVDERVSFSSGAVYDIADN